MVAEYQESEAKGADGVKVAVAPFTETVPVTGPPGPEIENVEFVIVPGSIGLLKVTMTGAAVPIATAPETGTVLTTTGGGVAIEVLVSVRTVPSIDPVVCNPKALPALSVVRHVLDTVGAAIPDGNCVMV